MTTPSHTHSDGLPSSEVALPLGLQRVEPGTIFASIPVRVGDTYMVNPWIGCGKCPACLKGQDYLCPAMAAMGMGAPPWDMPGDMPAAGVASVAPGLAHAVARAARDSAATVRIAFMVNSWWGDGPGRTNGNLEVGGGSAPAIG